MANSDRRTVEYNLDSGESVNIQIAYDGSDNATVSSDTRYTAGGFGTENLKCAGILTRRILKPRYVIFEVDNEDGSKSRVDVIYKTREGFDQVIGGGQTSMEGVPKRYIGEQYTVCVDDSE